ncbi:MAG TPA: hypothetical protein VE173_08235, partial [Longimicrobiales bacterium]|nr:hypothetical protein [Longimicrobiales bacterium]
MSHPILVDRNRSILRVWGRDPVKMIHGLATADIETVSPERGVYTAFLTPKGRMVADARVFLWPRGAEKDEAGAEARGGAPGLLVGVDPRAAEDLKAHIRKFVPPLFARSEDRSDEWRVIGVYGVGADEAVAGLAGGGPDEPEAGAFAAARAEESVVALGARAG